MSNVRLMVVDDHPMLRSGIVSLFNDNENMEVVSEARNGKEAIANMESVRPDVVLMDINMDGKLDVHTTEEIVKRWPEIKVLAFSMHDEAQVIKRMLKAGVSGYLLKNAPHSELLRAVNALTEGKKYYSQEVLSVMTHNMTSDSEADLSEISLSNREKQVLHYVAKEYTNQEIADKIHVSLRTVETHKRNLIKKLRVKNVVGLVRFALEQGQFLDMH